MKYLDELIDVSKKLTDNENNLEKK